MSAPTEAPVPPLHLSELAGCHWLQRVDFDGRREGLEVYQWQPVAKRWCRVGAVATGQDLDLDDYVYVAPCPMPLPEHRAEELARLQKTMNGRFRTPSGAYVQRTTITSGEWDQLNEILFRLLP